MGVGTKDTRGLRFRRRLGRKTLVAMIICASGAAALLVYTVLSYRWLENQTQDHTLRLSPPSEDDTHPVNVLIVGSDSREGLSEAEQQSLAADDVTVEGEPITGERADTLLFARVDPAGKVVVVQFPRDLFIGQEHGAKRKIGEYLLQGREALVGVVESLTGMELNHYVQLNIAGFRDLVDAIGGVELCMLEPIPFDPGTGFELEPSEIGMVTFDGDRAIRFVRSRKAFPGGDFDRIANQQRFLSAALTKVTSARTIIDIPRIERLKRVLADHVVVDRDTSLKELIDIVLRLRASGRPDYEAHVAPNRGVTTAMSGGLELSIVRPAFRDLRKMFDAIEQGQSLRDRGFAPIPEVMDRRHACEA